MFNSAGLTRGLTLTRIISGLSKTLKIANQIIPLYEKAKPALTNAQKLFKTFKEITSSNATNENNNDTKLITKKEEPSIKASPTFFL
jgi:hypothetical protein